MNSYSVVALSTAKGDESTQIILESSVGDESFTVEQDLSLKDKAWIKEQVRQLKDIKSYVMEREEKVPEGVAVFKSQKTLQPEAQTKLKSSVHIFISFSMPVASLKAWSREAQKVNGTLVLRGLVENSLKKTLQKVLHVFGEDNLTTITIDPVAFKQFGIKAVPAIVVTPTSDEKETRFDVVYGDVSLTAALQSMVEDGENTPLAKQYLNILQGHHE